jgi:hypothetical protein
MQRALLTLLVVLLGLSGAPANAMPFGSLPVAAPNIVPVAMGCGPGWTWTPHGHCHPMGRMYYG